MLNETRYLVKILRSYMDGHTLTIRTPNGTSTDRPVIGGVPQDSVLDLTLWKVIYDNILRMDVPVRVQLVGLDA